jgi:hypothetical protein
MTDPLRPLGQAGRAAWDDFVVDCPHDVLHLLQLACEQLDERASLRVRVLKDNLPAERRALRALDSQVAENLSRVMMAIQAKHSEDDGDAFDRLAAELSTAMGDGAN